MSLGHKARVALRRAAVGASAVLPGGASLRFERYLRGMEDFRMLGESDVIVVSFGKSGRTWLRVLLSRYFQIRHGLPSDLLLTHDNLHALNRAVPRVFFTHDNYLGDYTGSSTSKAPYAGRRTVLLVRHPADTAVSQYHQWKHRMRPRKKFINAYPGDAGMNAIDFVLDSASGIPKIVRFMNDWAAQLDRIEQALVVRYETLKAETAGTFGRILAFMGETPTPELLAQCVEFASIENMRAMERDAHFRTLGRRLRPGDAANPDSYKVRRAASGGYRGDFSAAEVARIDALIAQTLSPFYGYGGAPAGPRVI